VGQDAERDDRVADGDPHLRHVPAAGEVEQLASTADSPVPNVLIFRCTNTPPPKPIAKQLGADLLVEHPVHLGRHARA
jgi:hypothetical protein